MNIICEDGLAMYAMYAMYVWNKDTHFDINTLYVCDSKLLYHPLKSLL